MPRPRKGPFKGKGADSRAARREAPVNQPVTAPVPRRDGRGNPAAKVRKDCCNSGDRAAIKGWILIGSIAVQTPTLPLAVTVAHQVRPLLAGDGHCQVGPIRLRWMRLQQFYRHIGALP